MNQRELWAKDLAEAKVEVRQPYTGNRKSLLKRWIRELKIKLMVWDLAKKDSEKELSELYDWFQKESMDTKKNHIFRKAMNVAMKKVGEILEKGDGN